MHGFYFGVNQYINFLTGVGLSEPYEILNVLLYSDGPFAFSSRSSLIPKERDNDPLLGLESARE